MNRRARRRRLRRRVIGSLAVAAGVWVAGVAVAVAAGSLRYPLWVQVGNGLCVGLTVATLGLGYLRER